MSMMLVSQKTHVWSPRPVNGDSYVDVCTSQETRKLLHGQFYGYIYVDDVRT
jgi:hypothetical protein